MRTLHYMRRKNLGNYEHEEIGVTVDVADDIDLDITLNNLKAFVLAKLGLQMETAHAEAKQDPKPEVKDAPNTQSPETQSVPSSNQESAENTKSDGAKGARKPRSPKAKVDKEVVEQKSDKEDVGEASPEVREPSKRSSYIPYNRELNEHKAIMKNFCRTNYGENWSKVPGVTELSQSLVGQDFLDGEGNVCATFKAKCDEFFKDKV